MLTALCCVWQTDEQEVINFLLTTEVIPLCLQIMQHGTELSKTVATFILQKILLDETGKILSNLTSMCVWGRRRLWRHLASPSKLNIPNVFPSPVFRPVMALFVRQVCRTSVRPTSASHTWPARWVTW